ncbi:MAG: hypothetical protein ACOZAA_13605 [Pseudomonadota bacterium]
MDNIKEVVAATNASGQVWGKWFEMPLARAQGPKGRYATNSAAPFVPDGWVSELSTHELRYRVHTSEQRMRFLIASFGFLAGMSLLPEGWGHLWRFPVTEGVNGDFLASRVATERHLVLFDEFYSQSSLDEKRLLLSAFVQLRRAAATKMIWDQYLYQYLGHEALMRIFESRYPRHFTQGNGQKLQHARTPSTLCKKCGIPVPRTARVRTSRRSRPKYASTLSNIRNRMAHYAQFGRQPIGEDATQDLMDAMLDLQGINCRSILYLIGSRSAYVATPVDTRQQQFLTA